MTRLLHSRWGVPSLLVVMLALSVALGVAAGAGDTGEPSADAAASEEAAEAQQLPAAPAPRPTNSGGRDPFAIPGGAPVTFSPIPVPPLPGPTTPTYRSTSPVPVPTSAGKEGSVASPSTGSGGAGSLGGRTIKVVSVDLKLGAALVELDGRQVLLQLGDGADDHFLVEISDNCAGIRSYIAGQEIENTICTGETVEIITR